MKERPNRGAIPAQGQDQGRFASGSLFLNTADLSN
jgi:hypothetical protein